MPGRQGQGKDPRDRTSGDSNSSLNGAGKQYTPPRRPPGMARLDTPPNTPRVARPKREKPRKSRGKRLLTFVVVLTICGILVFIIVYGLVNYFIGIGSSAGAANTAGDFLTNLQGQHYDLAYKDLGPQLTIIKFAQASDFITMAQADDRCYGLVTNNSEVQGSAIYSADGNTQMYTYDMTRSKLPQTYQLTLTIQKQSDGTWDIINFTTGSGTVVDLGPAPPTCP
jgi:hypothetical protein